ncbi:MAG: SDR family oxidoreductase [Gemmataceae bacterium]|nr:SDR family oxidoreductase [Gemmataceae bacterium]
MNLNGKIVLVTGGGSGIGKACAGLLHGAGAEVIICGRNLEKLEKAAREEGAPGREIHTRACDASVAKQVHDMVASILKMHGRIDILVHCAGVNVKERSFSELTPESWHFLIDGNLHSGFHCIRETVPGMRARKNGLIIVVNSVAGLRGSPLGGSGYVAGKFGLHGLVVAAAAEESKNGIRFCQIYPGEVNTPILDVRPNPVSEEHRHAILQPVDIAKAALFLAQMPGHVVIPELVIIPQGAVFI